MSRRKLYRIIIEAAAGILLIFVLVFFLGFRVTGVQVEGNSFYTDDQIKKYDPGCAHGQEFYSGRFYRYGKKHKR